MGNIMRCLAACALLVALGSCGSVQRCQQPEHRNEPACAIVNNVIDCTTTAAVKLVDEFASFVEAAIVAATSPDGTIDWSKLEPMLVSAGIADGMCVVASVVAKLTRASTSSGSPRHPSFDSISIGFDKMRAKIVPGVKFRTRWGDV